MKINIKETGSYAFIGGVGVAILAGLLNLTGGVAILILVFLGLIVGFLNITQKETTAFLVAAIALMAAGTANISVIPVVGELLQAVLSNITVLVAPAAIVVGLKEVYTLARSKE